MNKRDQKFMEFYDYGVGEAKKYACMHYMIGTDKIPTKVVPWHQFYPIAELPVSDQWTP